MVNNQTADAVVLEKIAKSIQTRRLDMSIKQAELAREAGVSLPTIGRIEAGQSVQFVNLIRVLRVLNLLEGLSEIVSVGEESPLETLRGTTRRRVRTSRQDNPAEEADHALPWGASS